MGSSGIRFRVPLVKLVKDNHKKEGGSGGGELMKKPKAEYPNRICSFKWYSQKEMDAFLEEQAATIENIAPRTNWDLLLLRSVVAALRGKKEARI